jgi:hypothetical protein
VQIHKGNFDLLFDTFHSVKSFLEDQYLSKLKLPDKSLDDVLTVSICGGAVRDTIFGGEIKDFDFYLIPKQSYERYFIQNILSVLDSDSEPSLFLESFSLLDQTLLESHYAKGIAGAEVVFKLAEGVSVGGQHLQFMFHVNRTSVKDVLNHFDLNICQFGWDGSSWYEGDSVDLESIYNALNHKEPVKLVNPVFPLATKSRLERFHKRFGCEIKSALKELEGLKVSDSRFFLTDEEVYTNYGLETINATEEITDISDIFS